MCDQHQGLSIEQIIEQYGNDVCRFAYLYLGDRGWAEDASQQVFLSAYQNLSKFQHRSSIRTWLYRITANTCKNILKSKAYRKALAECALDAIGEQGPADSHFVQEDSQVWRQVMRLSPTYRDVILLRYYKEYDVDEIAAILGISQSAVHTRLSRAYGKMRKGLEGGEHDEAQLHIESEPNR